MGWDSSGRFEDNASLVFTNRNLEVSDFKKEIQNGYLIITTKKLELSYKIGSGKFSPDNLSTKFQLNGSDVTWCPVVIETDEKSVSTFFDKTIVAEIEGQKFTFDFDDDGQVRISPEEAGEIWEGEYEQVGEFV